jgi:type VI secretion system protein VasD
MIPSRRALLAMPALLALATCAAPPPPKPPAVLVLTATGAADQNPDPSGNPSPVAISVYYLSSTGKFDGADVFALTERAKQTLGEDMAGQDGFVLAPGETHTLTHELKPGVQAVGIVALFRDIDRATWRASAPVADSGPTRLVLKVGKLSVSLAPAP